QNDVTLKMPAFEWVHVQLHQQKGMISLSPPTICNSAPAGLRAGSLMSVTVMKRKNFRMSVGRTVCGWIKSRLCTINS
ncbi:hypothetical protein M1960_27060, partial [Klebsiella pneumoniae]|nr:hypothetical protein [Klebsiella pneumoniae]MDZ2572155.1 hypothetical protein [Klebsiella pneumoniae]